MSLFLNVTRCPECVLSHLLFLTENLPMELIKNIQIISSFQTSSCVHQASHKGFIQDTNMWIGAFQLTFCLIIALIGFGSFLTFHKDFSPPV